MTRALGVKMIKIESSDNKSYKYFKSLLSAKGLKKEEHCLVMGQQLTQEVEKSQPEAKVIHFDEGLKPDYLLTKDLYKSLLNIKTESKILLVPFKKPLEYSHSAFDSKELEVFLPVGDPKNLGALVRTSLAFHATKIVLLEEAAHPFLPESIRSSSGTVFKAPLYKGPSLKNLKIDDLWTLDKGGESLYSWRPDLNKGLKILLGEEGGHLTEAQKKKTLAIPINEHVESLNVNSALSCTLSWINSLKKQRSD